MFYTNLSGIYKTSELSKIASTLRYVLCTLAKNSSRSTTEQTVCAEYVVHYTGALLSLNTTTCLINYVCKYEPELQLLKNHKVGNCAYIIRLVEAPSLLRNVFVILIIVITTRNWFIFYNTRGISPLQEC